MVTDITPAYKAKVIRVVNADTFEVYVDLGFNTFTYITVQLRMVNAPEISDGVFYESIGKQATSFVEGLLADNGNTLVLCAPEQGSLSRWIVDAYVSNESEQLVHVGKTLIDKGYVYNPK